MAKLRSRRVQKCIFCPNKADSKEHAWPDWVLKRFREYTVGSIHVSIQDKEQEIPPTQRAIKVRCVCEDCNTHWMKKLEDAVIPIVVPMMEDQETSLNILQQLAIARWAVKTAMVFEYATDVKPSIYFSPTDYELIHVKELLPQNAFVWIARCAASSAFHTDGRDLLTQRPHFPEIRGHITTLAYKHLAIQVFALRPPADDKRIVVPERGNALPWDRAAISIWPSLYNTSWPPPLSLDAEDEMSLADFCKSWLHESLPDPSTEKA